jgi:DNA-binding NarL/FixJ family response regulator
MYTDLEVRQDTAITVCAKLHREPRVSGMPSVLIVDDSADVRCIVRTFLENNDPGFAVCGEAANGLEAIKQAEVLKPDLILIDLRMPIMNGIETATVVRRILPNTQIVLFSNYTDDLRNIRTSVVGIDLVMAKGSLSDMAEALRKLTGRNAPPGPSPN